MIDDLRSAARSLCRHPGLTAVLVFSLACGAGANAMLFGMAQALLFRLPGAADPSSLVMVYTTGFGGGAFGLTSLPDFDSMAGDPGPFRQLAASDESRAMAVRIADRVADVRVAAVSEGFFPLLGLRAHAGRLLAPEDAGAPAAVISYALWTELGGNDAVLGRTLLIGERSYAIAGVTPRDFIGLSLQRECGIWIPLTPDRSLDDRGRRSLTVIGRLKPGASIDEADAHVSRIGAGLAERFPATNRGTRDAPDAARAITAVRYTRLDPTLASHVEAIGAIVLGAAAVLLAGAVINAGGLLLSRAVSRRRQFAVQVLLGATRAHLIRVVVAESLLVALTSAGLGLLLARWTAAVVPAFFAPEHARLLDPRLDLTAVAITLGLAMLAAALFSIGPALHAAHAEALAAVRPDAGDVSVGPGRARARGALVVAQVALSTILVAACGVLWTTMAASLGTGFGVPASRVAVASIQLTERRHEEHEGRERQDTVERVVAGMAGVEAMAWTTALPLRRENRRPYVIRESTGAGETIEPEISLVSRNYFEVMGIGLLEGRLFTAVDELHQAPVAVVSESFAREYFRDSAIGRRIQDRFGERVEIIGVVQSGRYRTLQEPPPPMVYHLAAREYVALQHLIVRAPAGARPPIDVLRAAIGGVTTLRSIDTLASQLSGTLALDRLTMAMVGLSAAFALLLAAMGVYGVMNDAVRQRRREIGLRMALGAHPLAIARVVMARALGLAGAGLAAGVAAQALIGAAVGSRVVLGRPDAATLSAALAALALIVCAAAILPIRRALRVHPAITLRSL